MRFSNSEEKRVNYERECSGMEEQNKGKAQKRTTIVGLIFIILAGMAALTGMAMTVSSMTAFRSFSGTSTANATYQSLAETSETMHFTPGFHHFETIDEAEYLNALTQIDAYGADGKTELVDVSIVHRQTTGSPHYHITYKVWLN